LQQIAELQKENFSLKLRIYFLEDRTKKEGIADGDVYNIVCAFHVFGLKQLNLCWIMFAV